MHKLPKNSDGLVDVTHYGNATMELCEALELNPFALKMLAESFLKSPPKFRRYGVRFKSHGLVFEIRPDATSPEHLIPNMDHRKGGFIK